MQMLCTNIEGSNVWGDVINCITTYNHNSIPLQMLQFDWLLYTRYVFLDTQQVTKRVNSRSRKCLLRRIF